MENTKTMYSTERRYILTAFCAVLWYGHISAAQENSTEITSDPVSISEPQVLTDELRVLLKPHREATISSLIAARIKKIHVKDGDRFTRGAPLVTCKCDVLQASLQAARARLKQHQLIHAANVELRRDNAVTKLDLALSEAKVEEGQAELALAQAQLRKCKVVAPFDGRVVKILVNEHESVEVGGELLSILDDERLELTLHAPSDQVTSIAPDQTFRVIVDETQDIYDAIVIAVVPKIDPTSRTVEITGRIVGVHAELVAGMSGSALFETSQ